MTGRLNIETRDQLVNGIFCLYMRQSLGVYTVERNAVRRFRTLASTVLDLIAVRGAIVGTKLVSTSITLMIVIVVTEDIKPTFSSEENENPENLLRPFVFHLSL